MKHNIAVWSVPLKDIPYFISDRAIDMPVFDIKPISQVKKRFENGNILRNHPHLLTIVWVTQGNGTCLADTDKVAISGSTVYYAKPSQFLGFEWGENTDGYIISFSLNFLRLYETLAYKLSNSELFSSFSSGTVVIPIDEHTAVEMDAIAKKMLTESTSANTENNEILPELLKIFLLYLNRQFLKVNTQCNKPGNSLLVKKFFNLLEKNYITCKTVGHYAGELAVTPNYLNEIIKKVTGSSARYHIQQRVVLEAKRKALYAELTMKEVAYNLGFEDTYHFSKYFKNVSGVNFTTFKREMTNQYRSI